VTTSYLGAIGIEPYPKEGKPETDSYTTQQMPYWKVGGRTFFETDHY
jgi:hypothetical protein